MNETREQWIEREARKARGRYWGGASADWDGASDDWRKLPEDIREDWRRVVAPYYQEPPEPLHVPVDVDGLARVIHEAECAAHGDPDIAAARVALTYLNIEPCAKPEYDPDDVALTPNERNELVNLRAEVKRLRHEVQVERDRANDLLADKNWAETECDRLRAQQPETRAMKVRFSVTAEEFAKWKLETFGAGNSIADSKIQLDYLAAHSAIDAPAGVPSVEELVEIGEKARIERCVPVPSSQVVFVTAVRDAILAGIQRREWTDADVEELGKVIHEGARKDFEGMTRHYDDLTSVGLRRIENSARAALAWFDGKRGVK